MKAKIKKMIRLLYHKIPINMAVKIKLKNFVYKHFYKILKHFFPIECSGYIKQNIEEKLVSFSAMPNNLKIVVHLHLFYSDLAKEFAGYLEKIKVPFDLLISIPIDQDKEHIQKVFEKNKYVQKIIVKNTKNFGRDYGPMFLDFREEILSYDILLHIHSKKSIWRGGDDGWRTYMLDSILGTSSKVNSILSMFQSDPALGIVYPETMDAQFLPYWGHTICQNYSWIKRLTDSLNIPFDDKYIDFPAGSMFWSRIDAIKPLYNLHLKEEDFGEEQGQLDGTLAHAIERCIVIVAQSNHYVFCTVCAKDYNFKKNVAYKNLHNYIFRKKEDIVPILKEFDIISFDIFDTLITRCVFCPDDLFRFIELNIKKQRCMDIPFIQYRKQAESNAIKKKGLARTSLNDIYDEFQLISRLSFEQCHSIKQIELECEGKFCIPRKDVLDIFNKLKDLNKRIILISDMYLNRNDIEYILKKCGYEGYEDVIISCEVGMRKDDGVLWDWYFKKYEGQTTIHVGDNELSDVIRVAQRNHKYLHLMQGKKMFSLTTIYPEFTKMLSTPIESVCMGLWLNKVKYNSPFYESNVTWNKLVIRNFFELGYIIYGILFLKFFQWLHSKLQNEVDVTLFLSREGYYLKQVYEVYLKAYGLETNKRNLYFYTSRRAASVAAIHSLTEIEEILQIPFYGDITDLFKARFGINIQENGQILLPDQSAKAAKIAKQYLQEILQRAAKERDSYRKYLNTIVGSDENARLGFIDIGYSGTIQYFFSKVVKNPIYGYYFALSDKVKTLPKGYLIKSCFGQHDPNRQQNYIVRFGILLENFLSAPHGQVMYLKEKEDSIEPVYLESPQKDQTDNQEIFAGVAAFIGDFAKLVPHCCLTEDSISSTFSQVLLKNMIANEDLIPNSMRQKFIMDDDYCKDVQANMFDVLVGHGI